VFLPARLRRRKAPVKHDRAPRRRWPLLPGQFHRRLTRTGFAAFLLREAALATEVPMSPIASAAGAVNAAKPRPSSGRFDLLDGVRGWAALSVVLFHIFWEIFGALVPAFRNPATGFLFDGQLAVCVFFVLSGEALSASFFAGKGDASTIRLAIKRYPRLATPILAASLVIFALDRLGLVFNQEAASIVHRTVWMGGWLAVPPSFIDTL
jgi:hypothetical protein